MVRDWFKYTLYDLDYPIIHYYIPPTWLSTLISFMHNAGLQLIDDIAILQTLCQDDNFFMSCFIQVGYQGFELCKLNFMQMHLHAITITDIVSADGQHISEASWKLRQSNGLRKQIIWPSLEEEVPHSWIDL